MQLLDLVASTRKPTRVSAVCLLVAGMGAGSFLLLRGAAPQESAGRPAAITVDYPANGSVFPPEITPSTFLWRDPAIDATAWTVDVSFADGAPAIHVKSAGEPIDRKSVGEGKRGELGGGRKHLKKDN